jgi:hypothetical protein
MLNWLYQQLLNTQAQRAQAAALLARLEQQALVAREQLNASLMLAHTAAHTETQVAQLALAKSQLAQLQAIAAQRSAAQRPSMHVKNEAEVTTAIEQLEKQFARAGYYTKANARRSQHASVHVHLSPQSEALLRAFQSGAPQSTKD